MADSNEELITIRLKASTWYRAILLEELIGFSPLGFTTPRERYEHRLCIRVSHNKKNFRIEDGSVFRLLSTNLIAYSKSESANLPVAICSGDVRILEELAEEPEQIYIGESDGPLGRHFK